MRKNYKWLMMFSLCSMAMTSAHVTLATTPYVENESLALQEKKIGGTIKDELDRPVPGVTIRNLNSGASVQTDQHGAFEIAANSTDVLQISSIGYATQEIKINNTTENYQIVLLSDSQTLEEVVLIGYGKQSRSLVAGAVASADLSKQESRSNNSVGEMLQGRAPGVVVQNEGGDPTSPPRVNIRGLGGINGETPLYVVDGSIYPGVPVLNPNDIESMSVLKDASASIYGARASGGVILVTTKSGNKNGIKLNLDLKQGFQQAWNKPTPLNAEQRAYVSNLAADNAGVARNDAFNAEIYPEGQITQTNWIEEVFQNGYVQDYGASLESGGEYSTVFSSFNFRKAEGILLNTYNERANIRMNGVHQIKPWLTLGEHFYLNYDNGNGAYTEDGYTGALISAIYYPSNVPVYDENGAFSGLPAQYGPGSYGDVINPVAYLQRLDVDNPTYNFIINPYVEIKLAEGLKFRSNYSMTQSFNNFKEFTTKVPEIGKPSDANRLDISNTRIRDILAEQVLTYDKNFGVHHLDLLGGFTFQKNVMWYSAAAGQDFVDESENLRYLSNAGEILTPEDPDGIETSSLVSYLTRINYHYDQRYVLTLTGRYDGSSLVAAENRFQPYGSVAGAWVLKRESFLEDVNWLSDLRLRGSYGILGNLGSLTQFSVNPLLYRAQTLLGESPDWVYYTAEDQLPNQDLTWAQSNQTNIGLDIGFLNNRLSIIADYFKKRTTDMIMDLPLSGTVGIASRTINGGEVEDRGFELGINYSSDRDKAFQYSIGANIATLRNEVLSLAGGVESIALDNNYRQMLNPIVIAVGQPLYSFNVVQTDGIFQSQEEVDAYTNSEGELIQPFAQAGDFKFVDANGDGVIDANDRVIAGDAYPDFSYGLNFNASYKGFDFNVFFQGVQGNELFNATKFSTLNAGVGQQYNMLVGVLDAWTPENPTSTLPRVSLNDANSNFYQTSDFYIEDGSYLRLKNLTIGYTLPASLTSKMHLGSLRIYATGTNLLTWTKYTGFDPEVGMDTYGMDSGRYPQSRSFLVGLNIGL